MVVANTFSKKEPPIKIPRSAPAPPFEILRTGLDVTNQNVAHIQIYHHMSEYVYHTQGKKIGQDKERGEGTGPLHPTVQSKATSVTFNTLIEIRNEVVQSTVESG